VKALVIEDSERLRRSLSHGLEQVGWEVEAVADGTEGLAALMAREPDVVVLDLMLPGLPGLEVLRRARAAGSEAQILVLSARDHVDDRVRGLQLGADDYLVKPFSFDELCARLEALVRRPHARRDRRIVAGQLEIDLASKRAYRKGEPLHLTPSEFSVLEMLVLRRGKVTSQQQILERLYQGSPEVSSNVIEVLISGLRRKIQDPATPVAAAGGGLIQTRRGHGYVIE
jgi:two-component system copper resistance phosphate regulon response regulator CusR